MCDVIVTCEEEIFNFSLCGHQHAAAAASQPLKITGRACLAIAFNCSKAFTTYLYLRIVILKQQ
jgi:hypothetical protein